MRRSQTDQRTGSPRVQSTARARGGTRLQPTIWDAPVRHVGVRRYCLDVVQTAAGGLFYVLECGHREPVGAGFPREHGCPNFVQCHTCPAPDGGTDQ